METGERGLNFEGRDVNCKSCGAHEETLEHFILQCRTLQYMRDEYKITGVTIQNILGFEKDGDTYREI